MRLLLLCITLLILYAAAEVKIYDESIEAEKCVQKKEEGGGGEHWALINMVFDHNIHDHNKILINKPLNLDECCSYQLFIGLN